MKLQIKQYEYEKKEIASKEIQLPSETSYYFETGIRRSIKIIPRFTSWNKEQYNKEEELYELIVICLYQSSECKAEKFTIRISGIEEIYYSKKHEYKDFVTGLIDGWFNKRTKEQFDIDFDNTHFQKCSVFKWLITDYGYVQCDKLAQNLIKKQKIMDIEKLKLEAQNKALHIADVSGSALFNADCMDILPLIPDKSVQLIFADPPYFKIKGDFDFIWKSFDEYLIDVEKWALECKRILADNGTVLWYGHSKHIAYSQIVLDKFFKLESNIAIELTAGHIRRSNKESFRRFAPCSERILMYSTGKNNKELCGDLIRKINETATAKQFIDCFIKLGICKNEASAKVLATYKIGKHKTRFDLMSKEMYDFIGGWNYSYEYFTELFNKSIRTFNSKGVTDVFRYKENTKI